MHILCSIIIGIGILYSSCDDYDYKTDYSWLDEISSVKVEGVVDNTLEVNLYKPDKLMLGFDSEQELDIRTFLLTSSDTNVFKVNLVGDLEPKGLGKAKLIVKHRISEKLTTSCDIHVWSDLEDIVAKADPVLVKVGTPVNLNDYILLVPSKVDNAQLEYESLNPEVLTIDKTGNMQGVKEAMAQVKVTSIPGKEGAVITKIFNVQVKDKILVSRIELYGNQGKSVDINKLDVIVNQEINIAENLYVGADDADVKDVTYSIDNPSVATISDEGLLKIVGKGTATLAIASTDGSNITKTVSIDSNGTLYARNFWDVSTSITYDSGNNFIPDGATGRPEHMLDGSTTTFLSLAKPGKSPSAGHSTPVGHQLYFIVDMKTQQEFNYVLWKHRSNNATQGLRVWGISVYGSNDGENFTPIIADLDVPYTVTEPAPLEIPTSNYRYVKVHYDKFSTTQSMSLQVSEFGLGIK